MDINMWHVVENVRVASGAFELAVFTAILYWFFTSSRVADMLEVVGERVGGWCGREATGQAALRQVVQSRKRQQFADVYSKIDNDRVIRTNALARVKEGPVVPPPVLSSRPPAGLACMRCAPVSRESWHDPKAQTASDAVINVLDIGRQAFANGGVVSRYLCDLAHCSHLSNYDYKDVVPDVVNDELFQRAIEETTQTELSKLNNNGSGDASADAKYDTVKKQIEVKAMKVLLDISSAMSNAVLKLVAWVCHKAIRRIAGGGCATRAACVERLRRAKAAGLPVIFVPLHRSHFDYILVTFTLYLTGLRPPLVAAGDNMRIPFFGWFLRGCGAFYIRRRVDGSEYHGDPVYKSALRAYILNSLAAKNNLEFFIEGGRTRTGKPQPPKAGILSVIMDAYLDGTIDDALLVPVTLNYDKLVDGNFVREQLGMPKQMETFWSAFRGIWSTLNTNHGGIRVDFNQPISLKELVTSFQKYNYLKAPVDKSPSPPNNNLAYNLDRQILYNHSHSSLYGDNVSTEHKMMVEGIGRHLVYDAAQSTALMSTNIVSYVLLTEERSGCSLSELMTSVRDRQKQLRDEGRFLGYRGAPEQVVGHALDMLGRGLVRRSGAGDTQIVKPILSISSALQLSYYANTVVAHYAAPAIVATALETVVLQSSDEYVLHSDILEASLQLCEVLSQEFILCPPCQRIEDLILETMDNMAVREIFHKISIPDGLDEQMWSRRFAMALEEEDDDDQVVERITHIKYKISKEPAAIAERCRLIQTIRPLLEAYSTTCRSLKAGSLKQFVKDTLDTLTSDYTKNIMIYGEAVSTDAIRNCLRLLKQWGVIEMVTQDRDRMINICAPYDTQQSLDDVCSNVYKFNMDTPLLNV